MASPLQLFVVAPRACCPSYPPRFTQTIDPLAEGRAKVLIKLLFASLYRKFKLNRSLPTSSMAERATNVGAAQRLGKVCGKLR